MLCRGSLSFFAIAILLAPAPGCGGQTESGRDAGRSDGGKDASSTGHDAIMRCKVVHLLPPILTVTDGVTGAPVCDIVLLGSDAGATLTACAGAAGCAGKCPYLVTDQGGSSSKFGVTIAAPGYSPAVVLGLVTRECDGCGAPCPAPDQASAVLSPVRVADAGVDAAPPGCPSVEPVQGSNCRPPRLACEYGTTVQPQCDDVWNCSPDAGWQLTAPWPGCLPASVCPAAYPSVGGNEPPCDAGGLACAYPEGTCGCAITPNTMTYTVWVCGERDTNCPWPRPRFGTPCDAGATGNPVECPYGDCSGGVVLGCNAGYWGYGDDIACNGN